MGTAFASNNNLSDDSESLCCVIGQPSSKPSTFHAFALAEFCPGRIVQASTPGTNMCALSRSEA